MTAAMTRFSSIITLAGVALLAACEKNAVQSITKPIDGGAFVRFHNFSVSSPGVNFYANDQKLTAVSSAACSPPPATPNPACSTTGVEATTGVAYGATAIGGNYTMLAPGTYTFTGRVAAATDNGLRVTSLSAPLEAGKFYSYFMSGIYNATAKSADAFFVEDKLPTSFDYTKAYIRIVNASSNSPSVSATTQRQGTTDVVTVATNLPYKGVSPIIEIAPGLTDITVRLSTGPSAVLTGANLLGGHVLTLALRGDATSTSATTGLTISSSYNR